MYLSKVVTYINYSKIYPTFIDDPVIKRHFVSYMDDSDQYYMHGFRTALTHPPFFVAKLFYEFMFSPSVKLLYSSRDSSSGSPLTNTCSNQA